MDWWLVLFGIFVHVTFFYSIFDIYFTSPLVHGMTPQSSPLPAPAHRLVLFVADGLRADKLFELDQNNQTRAPFIRSIIEKHGAWGVSHTRVPTESRPGHVALIAGFYEDVSAITKGWKENPVEFDSVFNESSYTWSWGSPDILPMFSKGASGSHVYTEMYPGESEDFAGADLHKLDTWVFDRVKEFIKRAENDVSLAEKLNMKKVVLFMHLLGIDTNGHAHRPYSKEYLENIKLVDKGIEEMVSVLENYFHLDGKTAYVFTADHGMTNWGSHGAGHPSETLTPLVAWGAGVRKPLPISKEYEGDGLDKEWYLTTKRSDVNQADISPLMATLIGIPVPLNSVGILPLDYLNGSSQFKAEAMFTNARQIVEQFEVKMLQKQKTTLTSIFSPFRKLTPSMKADKLRLLRTLIQEGKFQEAISESHQLIELALEGLSYYHNYDKLFLGVSICLGFLGWIIYIFTVLIQKHTNITQKHFKLDELQRSFWLSEKGLRVAFGICGLILTVFLYVQSLPLNYYLYCLVPVVLWHKVAQRHQVLYDVYCYIVDHGFVRNALLLVVIWLAGLELIVWSFTYRELLSIGLVAMATWPLFIHSENTEKTIASGWIASVLSLAVFPLLPVVGREANYYLVYLAGILILCCAMYVCLKEETAIFSSSGPNAMKIKALVTFQLFLVILSVLILHNTQANISQKQGLPLVNQVLSWSILLLSFILPLFSSTLLYQRLVSIALSFTPVYILLSMAHEVLFFLNICFLMFFWLRMENSVRERNIAKIEYLDFSISRRLGEVPRKLYLTDLRCAYFFILFLFTAFFGTGNIASINSFDPSSVLCFLTIFSPFVMGALMMCKILVPFMLVTCAFNAIHLCANVPTQSLFLLVILMSDIMALNFFFLVRDYGSWLEIGTSISHYVIVMTTIIFLNVLLAVSRVFTNYQIRLKRTRQPGKEQ